MHITLSLLYLLPDLIYLILESTENCWESKNHACPVEAPIWLHEKEPSMWNTFLPKDKQPTQPGPGLSPGRAVSFPIPASVNALWSLLRACVSYDSRPIPGLQLSSMGNGQSCCSRRGLHVGKLSCVDHWERSTNLKTRSHSQITFLSYILHYFHNK